MILLSRQIGRARRGAALALALSAWLPAVAAEHVTLKNGFELDCARRTIAGDRTRLYFEPTQGQNENYMEVASDAVVRIETVPDVVKPQAEIPARLTKEPTTAELHEMLAHAGVAHNIDADLLASVVRAESGGRTKAVSRTGAQGLMQLMPRTATDLGVQNAFQPDENIKGGSAYLDALLTRYHDSMALALAAYNAGPGAVDRYHGVPPYRETRLYVARVIREFNRRKQLALTARAQ